MQVPYFIAHKLAFSKYKSFSRFIIRLSIVATALSVSAMILTLAFVNGFQTAVAEKVYKFWGHIRVQPYEHVQQEDRPQPADFSAIRQQLQQVPGVAHIQGIATKACVATYQSQLEGIIFKGVDYSYNFTLTQTFLVAGKWPTVPADTTGWAKEVVMGEALVKKMQLALGKTVSLFFIDAYNNASTKRTVKLVGIYKTGIEEYDKTFVLGDINLINKVDNYVAGMVGGYEVIVKDASQIQAVNDSIYNALPTNWTSRTVPEIYPNIFDWLQVQNVNRDVVFIIMGIVAFINLITCLLILVLERTKMVGLLQAVGASNWQIQQVFIFYASFIATIGIGIGVAVGTGIYWAQKIFAFIQLDEAAYYVNVAPVDIHVWEVAAIALGTFVACFLSLLLPSILVRKIVPVVALRFK